MPDSKYAKTYRTWYRLAAEFRLQGFEVIEGYPGGAQDILGIPRKGKGISELSQGLENFGITGSLG